MTEILLLYNKILKKYVFKRMSCKYELFKKIVVFYELFHLKNIFVLD